MFSNIFNSNSQQPQPQPQSSLFNAQPSSGGLFGSSSTQAQPQQQGLFGQKPAAAGGSSLFGNLLGGGSNPPASNTFLTQQPNPNPSGVGLFGGIPNTNQTANPQGSGLFGNPMGSNTVGAFGNNQNPAQGGMGMFGQPQGQSTGLFGGAGAQTSQQSTGLFGGISGGGSTLGANPMGSNQLGANPMGGNPQGMGNNMFGASQPSQNPSSGLFGAPSPNTNSFGGMGMANQTSFGMGGNTGMVSGGTIGIPYDRSQTKKNNENCWVQSINAMQSYKDKNLQELRIDDYKAIREGRLPDDMKMLLQSGQSLANYQSKPTGGFGSLSSQSQSTPSFNNFMGGNTQTQPNSSFFGNNTPNLLTSKPNTNTPSGSLFGQSNTATPTTGSFFGNQPTNNQAIATPMFGGLTQNTTQPQTGSLFGTSAFGQNTAQKPLFGGASTQISSNTNTNTSGGLFNTGGGNAGLFSQPNQQTGGIFGNSTQPNTFGNNFMNKPNEPSGTGLFGNLTTPQNQAQQPQTGLFNQSQPMYNQTQPSFGQPNQNNNMNYPQTGIFQGNPQQAQAQQTMDMNMGRTPGYYPFDPNSMQNQPNSMFTGSQLFTNAPNQNNWLYHDWDKEYQSFYGSNYEDSDDLGFFPYIPYKKRDNNIRNPNMFKNMTISSRKNETRDGNEFLGEKKKNLGLERRKEYQDREPNVLGYNQSGSSLLKGSYREEDNRRGFAGDRERIQELLDPGIIRLIVELKGPKQGVFPIECELDVTIGEMKSQILEIFEKNLSKPFLSQEKFFKIMVMHPEKGILVLNDNHTIEHYHLKNNQTITLIKDLNVDDNEQTLFNPYYNQLAPESMIPILTKPGYSIEPSLRQLSRMNEEQLRKIENFTIRNEFATVKFEGYTDVRNLNLDKIVNFTFRSVELYPEEVYNESNKPAVGKELNKPALIVFHKFKIEENERLTKEKIIKKLRKWTKKCNMEFLNFDFEHGNLTTRVPNF